ncbi:hypothetical protein [Cryobacterium sp. PAMC25264]|uniref:hypothetical protein n=1 Tax=Cryobacterium sp. PAMC25264 TaxID=2861288 RepID=UPI001C62F0B5|nr:hypothetical protein [Cryobacterium sp. PAMC25264]QYF74881.1 hypothetical protein KY500_07030 [Cryobacterium sp. PAMC25264]
MQSDAIIEPCDPTHGIAVQNPSEDVIYLIPSASGRDGRPAYMGTDALLVKRAVAEGVPVRYSLPEQEREFVEHFSAGIEIIELAVAIIALVPSTIQGIQALIELAAMRKGFKGDAVKRAKVHLKIDYLKTPTTEARGVRIKGDADKVVEALKELGAGS